MEMPAAIMSANRGLNLIKAGYLGSGLEGELPDEGSEYVARDSGQPKLYNARHC